MLVRNKDRSTNRVLATMLVRERRDTVGWESSGANQSKCSLSSGLPLSYSDLKISQDVPSLPASLPSPDRPGNGSTVDHFKYLWKFSMGRDCTGHVPLITQLFISLSFSITMNSKVCFCGFMSMTLYLLLGNSVTSNKTKKIPWDITSEALARHSPLPRIYPDICKQ